MRVDLSKNFGLGLANGAIVKYLLSNDIRGRHGLMVMLSGWRSEDWGFKSQQGRTITGLNHDYSGNL